MAAQHMLSGLHDPIGKSALGQNQLGPQHWSTISLVDVILPLEEANN